MLQNSPNEVVSNMLKRRSIRRFRRGVVLEQKVTDLLLKAGFAAPSANNLQPWHFIIVKDTVLLEKLAEIHPHGKMAADAGNAIVVCGNTDSVYWEQDCSAAAMNILNAAASLDLGSLWLGVHPRQERKDKLAELFHVIKPFEILAVILLGLAEETKEPRSQYDPDKISNNTMEKPF